MSTQWAATEGIFPLFLSGELQSGTPDERPSVVAVGCSTGHNVATIRLALL